MAFLVRLDMEQTEEFLRHLEGCAACQGREWFAVTSSYDKPQRLRLTKELRVPDYELQAPAIYLRGEPVRISGREGSSCNINFSGAVGSWLLMRRVRSARERMRRFLEIRIPSRKHNLIAFFPDTDLEAVETPEHHKLAQTGATLAGDIWVAEDFSDWESHGG